MRLGEIAGKEQDLERFCSSIGNSIIEKLKEIVAKDKQLNLKEEELERKKKQYEERLRELELHAGEIEEDRDKVAGQQKGFELRDVQFRELEDVRRKCEADGKILKKRMHKLDFKEKQFEGRVQEFDIGSRNRERKFKELESNKNKTAEARKKLDDTLHGVDQKEKQVDGRAKNPDLLSKDLARKHQVFVRRKRFTETGSKNEQLHSRERQLDLRSKDLERQHEELELNKRKFEADWKKLEERSSEVSRRERQLDSGLELLEIGKKDLCRQHKELESDKIKFEADRKKLDEQLLEVELKSKKTEEAMEELELKRKDLEEKFRKLESVRTKFKVDREKLDDLIASLEKQRAHLTEEEAMSEDNGVNQCPVVVADPNTPQLQLIAAVLPEIGDGSSDVQSLDSDSQHQTQDPLPKKRKLSDGKSISTMNADSSFKPEVGKDLRGVVLRQNLISSKIMSEPSTKKKDPAWIHASLSNPDDRNAVTCIYCGKVSKGGIHRHKQHLIGGFRNVKTCLECPLPVRQELKEYEEKKKKQNMAMSLDDFDNSLDDDEYPDVQALNHKKR